MKVNPSNSLKPPLWYKLITFGGITLSLITNNSQSFAQNITSANDTTGTIVNIDGNTFNITGGSVSGDGTNLFHSLQQFGLTSEQIANFLTNPNINNIFTRIVGGSPSFIDGLIQVTGGNSNLFLMNPAGMVFGSNASLNLLGDFTATTATGIGFDHDHWFNVIGDNNYALLNGNPSYFAFDLTENGTIINLGNLEVAKGQSLSLVGGTVINTGNLTAREGNINIVAIPGTSKIEISNPGDVMSIVVEVPRDNNGNILPIKATDIPTLITEGVTGLNINNNGEITTNLGTVIPQEQGININTGTIDVSSVENTGGNITILGNQIGVVDNSQILAFGNNGGGLIRIGGDYQGQGNIFNAQDTFIGENVNINASALTNGDGGRVIIWADHNTIFNGNIFGRGGNISGNGGFAEVSGKENLIFRGDVDLGAINGNFGTLLLDPTNIVISNDGTATISQATVEAMSGNTNILFEATNNITIGTLTNNDLTFQTGIGNITFTADSDNDGMGSFFMNSTDQIFVLNPSGVTEGRTLTITGFDITTGGIQGENIVFGGDYANTGGSTSNIILTATNNISMGQIRSASASVLPGIKGGDLSINAGGSITVTGNLVSWTSNDGGNITLKAQNDITINCTATNFCIETFSGGNPFIPNPTGNSGNLIIESLNGNINILGSNSAISTYVSGSGSGLPGNVELTASGDIKVSGIAAQSNNNNGNTGIVKIISTNGGTIDTSGGIINTSSYTTGNGATISIDTTGTVILGQVTSNAPYGTSGNINVINSNSIFLNQNIDSSGISGGEINFSGAVTLNNDVTLTGGDINFASTLDGQKNLTINSSGNVDFNDLVGSLTPLQSLNITDSTGINIYNNITTNNGITFNAPATVHNPVELNAGTGLFTNTISLNTGNNNLTITADDVNLTGTMTGTNNLIIQPFSTNRNIDLGTDTAGTLGITQTELNNLSNFSKLNIGRNDGTGNINITSDILFNLTTEIITSNSNQINFNANLNTLGQDLTLGNIFLNNASTISTGTGLGNINFNGTINGTQNLTVESGSGDISFNNLVGNTNALGTLDVNGNNINFNSSVNANSLTATNTGILNINAPLNLTNGLTQDGTGNTNLGANINTTNTDISFNSPVNLTNNVALNTNTGTGNVTFNNTLNGTFNLAIDTGIGNIFFNNLVGNNTSLGILDLNGNNINFNSSVNGNSLTATNTGILNINAPLTLTNGFTQDGTGNNNLGANITTTNTDISFNSPVNLTNNVTLNTGTGAGNINFNGTINGTQNLTINSGTGNTVFNGIVGGTNPLQNIAITTQNLEIKSQINTTNNGTFTLTNTGNFNLNAPLNLDGNFTQNGTGNNFLNNDILTTNDNISFASNVTLNNTLNLATGTGALSFGGALNLGNNPQTFTVGELNFNGGNNSVTGTNTLTIQTATDNQNINLGGTEGTTALDLTNNDLNALNTNFTNVTIGNDNGSGIMTVVSNINFTNPTILKMPKGNAVINGQITGTDDASLTLTALNTNLNNNLVTNNQDITLNTNSILGNNVRLSTGPVLGNINVNGTIDGNQNLILNSGIGNIILNGLLGGTIPLNSFTVTNASNLFLESGIIVNGTDLNFNSPVTLTNNTQLSTGTGAGNITINNTLNSAPGETNNLLLTLGTGNLTVNNSIGNNQRVGDMTINSANNITSNAPINANSLTSNNGTGTVNLNANVNTNNSTTLITNGDITTQNITTNGGNINLTSNNGNITVGNLTTSSATNGGNINLTSSTGIVNSGNLITNSTNNGGNVRVIALLSMALGNINTSAILGNGGSVFLDPIGDIQFGFINAQGGINGFGGNVDMTTIFGLVRGTGTFTDQNGIVSTISTAGGLGGGDITIRHNGGDLFIPFIVNDAGISGIAGALTTGDFTISPVRVFPGSYYFGNISIITSDRFRLALADSIKPAIPEEYKPKNVIEEGFFLDEYFTRLHERYLTQNANASDVPIKSLDNIQRELKQVEGETGVKPAIVYVFFEPNLVAKVCEENLQIESDQNDPRCVTNRGQSFRYENQDSSQDKLAIVVVTSDRKPQLIRMDFEPDNYPTRKMMIRQIKLLRSALTQVSDPTNPDEFNAYQEPSQQLYKYLMAPINNYLSFLNQELLKEGQNPVSNLVFIMDNELRSMPLAVLQNQEKQYIIQQEVLPKTSEFYQPFQELRETNRFYSLGLMPSMSLTDTSYRDVRDGELLAMGTDKFSSQNDLDIIPILLTEVTKRWNSNQLYLDEDFTQDNLKNILSSQSYSIINLGTHGHFDTRNPDNSYIQFYGGDSAKLRLGNQNNNIRNLGLQGTELLVLNACQTALGDKDSELGFAGFAYQLGVKSVLASLWEVAQVGTSGLMLQFYDNLKTNGIIKSEALRRAQLAMINGQVYNTKEQLIWSENNGNLLLPQSITGLGETTHNHPYYWSSFTIIGNPW